MNVTKCKITPEIARDILGKNENNRPIKNSNLKFLCGELKSGNWRFNGDAIRIATDGTLIDGQHRLEAVCITGISIDTLLVTGLEKSVFSTIDSGSARTGADSLSVIGEHDTKSLSAALITVESILSGKNNFTNSNKVSNGTIVLLLDKHKDIRNSKKYCFRLNKMLPPSMAMALHYLFSTVNEDRANIFFDSLIGGENIDSSNPIYILRQRLLLNTVSKSKLPKRYVAALVIKTWNAWFSGSNMRALKFIESGEKTEQFPIICGLSRYGD